MRITRSACWAMLLAVLVTPLAGADDEKGQKKKEAGKRVRAKAIIVTGDGQTREVILEGVGEDLKEKLEAKIREQLKNSGGEGRARIELQLRDGKEPVRSLKLPQGVQVRRVRVTSESQKKEAAKKSAAKKGEKKEQVQVQRRVIILGDGKPVEIKDELQAAIKKALLEKGLPEETRKRILAILKENSSIGIVAGQPIARKAAKAKDAKTLRAAAAARKRAEAKKKAAQAKGGGVEARLDRLEKHLRVIQEQLRAISKKLDK